MNTIVTVLCFLLILCVIVVVHEGGHALVARLTGMRVTEFYVGMPYGPEKSHVSKRSGIRYGATLALLGGYTRICGMAFSQDKRMALALALVNARGRLTTDELALALDCDPTDAQALIDALVDLGSIEPVYETGVRRHRKETPLAYRTVARDERGLTARDRGNSLVKSVAHKAGEPFDPAMSPDDFLAAELTHTYAGKSFIRRVAVLVAGVVFNLLLAFVILTCCYSAMHVQQFSLEVESVVAGSSAEQAGMQAGDAILAVAGTPVAQYGSVNDLSAAFDSDDFVSLDYRHAGEEEVRHADLTRSEESSVGLSMRIYLVDGPDCIALPDAVRASVAYIGTVASSVLSLLNPSEAPEVLSQSSGVVGIAQMTSQAVSTGPFDIIVLLAALSVSLGWKNLLPIPPLDGGKLVLEVIGRIIGREVPLWVQGALSLIGIAIVLALFVFMVFQDVGRIL